MTTISDQISIEINEEKVLRGIGYDTSCEPPARMKTLVNEYAKNARFGSLSLPSHLNPHNSSHEQNSLSLIPHLNCDNKTGAPSRTMDS